MDRCDVAILGAGPYGLSAAAHLCRVKGLDVRVVGEPMSFWERYMPAGMQLRSPWGGSHIADPGNQFTLDSYRALNGNHHLTEPLPVKDFIRYGRWFLREASLPVDQRKVVRIELVPQGYQLTLDLGESLHARRVVVAAGIQPFAFRPEAFQHFPSSLVTHTSERMDFSKFQGKEVLVIGGGQSALEAAVFLHEAGARTEVLVRGSGLYWLDHRRWMRSKPFRWMFYGAGEIGQAGASLIIQRPNLFRRLPSGVQHQWSVRALRPAVSRWIKPRAQNIPIHTEQSLLQARVEGERLRVRFSNGTDRLIDHLVLGTGYRVNVGKYPFLSPGILEKLDLAEGYPRLATGFETSVPGLHFLGAPAAWSYGPLMRFVAGTDFASPALCRMIIQAGQRLPAIQSSSVPQPFESVNLETDSPK